jgi:hypothetical protein
MNRILSITIFGVLCSTSAMASDEQLRDDLTHSYQIQRPTPEDVAKAPRHYAALVSSQQMQIKCLEESLMEVGKSAQMQIDELQAIIRALNANNICPPQSASESSAAM